MPKAPLVTIKNSFFPLTIIEWNNLDSNIRNSESIHNLLHCPNFSNERLILFNKLQSIDENILSKDHFNISKVLLFGDHSFNDVKKNTCFNCFN